MLRSRYHTDYPLSVKNPLTNQIIVGEVEFYLLEKTSVLACKGLKNEYLSAKYIGSDYTYAYSQRFRDNIFRDNTLDENLLIGVNPKPSNEIAANGSCE